MADPNRLAGVASVTIDGRPYNISGEGTYRCSTTKRESLVGQDGYHGYSEMPQPGKISWKGRDSGSLSIAALNEAAGVTVVLVLANGKTVIGSKMTRVGDPIEVNSEDATFTVEFEGGDVVEVAA
jgi:hypothetical protein